MRGKGELLPAENSLTVVPGSIGAYPNAFYRVSDADLPAFEKMLRALASEQDYRALADRFAVRRTLFFVRQQGLHLALASTGLTNGNEPSEVANDSIAYLPRRDVGQEMLVV